MATGCGRVRDTSSSCLHRFTLIEDPKTRPRWTQQLIAWRDESSFQFFAVRYFTFGLFTTESIFRDRSCPSSVYLKIAHVYTYYHNREKSESEKELVRLEQREQWTRWNEFRERQKIREESERAMENMYTSEVSLREIHCNSSKKTKQCEEKPSWT